VEKKMKKKGEENNKTERPKEERKEAIEIHINNQNLITIFSPVFWTSEAQVYLLSELSQH